MTKPVMLSNDDMVLLPSIILLEDDASDNKEYRERVLLPSIILLEDDAYCAVPSDDSVLLPSIILLEDDVRKRKR